MLAAVLDLAGWKSLFQKRLAQIVDDNIDDVVDDMVARLADDVAIHFEDKDSERMPDATIDDLRVCFVVVELRLAGVEVADCSIGVTVEREIDGEWSIADDEDIEDLDPQDAATLREAVKSAHRCATSIAHTVRAALDVERARLGLTIAARSLA